MRAEYVMNVMLDNRVKIEILDNCRLTDTSIDFSTHYIHVYGGKLRHDTTYCIPSLFRRYEHYILNYSSRIL